MILLSSHALAARIDSKSARVDDSVVVVFMKDLMVARRGIVAAAGRRSSILLIVGLRYDSALPKYTHASEFALIWCVL